LQPTGQHSYESQGRSRCQPTVHLQYGLRPFQTIPQRKIEITRKLNSNITFNDKAIKKSIFRFISTGRTATLCSSTLTRKHFRPVIRENSKFLESLAPNGTVFCVSWTRSILVKSSRHLKQAYFKLLFFPAVNSYGYNNNNPEIIKG
jgi:hypothetical protein